MKTQITFGLLLIAMLIFPVSAVNLTYGQDYISSITLADQYLEYAHSDFGIPAAALDSQRAIFYELRRQSILMEKQNELLAEQNELIRKFRIYPKVSQTTNNVTWCDDVGWCTTFVPVDAITGLPTSGKVYVENNQSIPAPSVR